MAKAYITVEHNDDGTKTVVDHKTRTAAHAHGQALRKAGKHVYAHPKEAADRLGLDPRTSKGQSGGASPSREERNDSPPAVYRTSRISKAADEALKAKEAFAHKQAVKRQSDAASGKAGGSQSVFERAPNAPKGTPHPDADPFKPKKFHPDSDSNHPDKSDAKKWWNDPEVKAQTDEYMKRHAERMLAAQKEADEMYAKMYAKGGPEARAKSARAISDFAYKRAAAEASGSQSNDPREVASRVADSLTLHAEYTGAGADHHAAKLAHAHASKLHGVSDEAKRHDIARSDHEREVNDPERGMTQKDKDKGAAMYKATAASEAAHTKSPAKKWAESKTKTAKSEKKGGDSGGSYSHWKGGGK